PAPSTRAAANCLIINLVRHRSDHSSIFPSRHIKLSALAAHTCSHYSSKTLQSAQKNKITLTIQRDGDDSSCFAEIGCLVSVPTPFTLATPTSDSVPCCRQSANPILIGITLSDGRAHVALQCPATPKRRAGPI